MAKYRKKPVVVEAIQYVGSNKTEILKFIFSYVDPNTEADPLTIQTLEGKMNVSINDWVIKGVNGEFYPCKPDIFEKTYEPVEAE